MTMALRQLLHDHHVPHKMAGEHHHATRKFIQVDCPFCSPRSGKYRMGLAIDLTRAVCWICGSRPLADALVALFNVSLRDVLSALQTMPKSRDRVEIAARGTYDPPAHKGPLEEAHRRYLIGRGFDPDELVDTWKIEGIGLAPRFPWRIFIPIYFQDQPASWTTRAIGTATAKYLTAPPERERIPSKDILYGWDFVSHTAIVVEGPIDAWSIGPGAVATMGLNVTSSQVNLLSKIPRRIICFDAEPAAQRRARQLAQLLSCLQGETTVVELETGKDANEASKEEIMELRSCLV